MSGQGVYPDDPGLRAVLAKLGVAPANLLGEGGEAWVYAIDDERVVRVLRSQGIDVIERRAGLVAELARADPPFLLPAVASIATFAGRHYAIERRLPGRSVTAELDRLGRHERSRLIEAHLDTAAALGDLQLDRRPWFGDLLADDPIRAATWSEYAEAKLAASLERAPGFGHLDPAELAAGLPRCGTGSFVHLDAFTGNMLADGTTITAVIDLGVTSVVGDRRLEPLSAAVYLCAEPITPTADAEDRRVAHRWLADAGLDEWYEPARRWLAAYWAWAHEDRELHRWCRSVLGSDPR